MLRTLRQLISAPSYFKFDKITNYVLILAFIMGFSLVFLVPPFQKADEIVHFYKTVAVANGQLNCGGTSMPGLIGYTIPQHLHEMPEKTRAKYILSHPNAIFPLELYSLLWKEDTSFKPAIEPASCTLPLLYYLPSGILLFPLVKLGAPSLIIFFMGRLINFLLAFVLALIALKRTPSAYRFLVLIVISLPMTMFQFSSYSKDWATLSIGLVFFAELLQLKFSQEKSYKQLFYVAVLSVLLILSRPTYGLLAPLVLLYSPLTTVKQLVTTVVRKYKRSSLLLLAFSFFACLVFLYLFATPIWKKFLFLWNQPYIDQVDARLQILHTIKHPGQFVHMLWNTLEKDWYFYWNSMIGILGWLDYGLLKVVYTIYYGLFFFLLFIYVPQSKAFSKREISILGLTTFSTIFLILFSHYVFSTVVAAHQIAGVQGRYFIPLIPFMVIVMSGVYYHWKKQIMILIGVGIVFVTLGVTVHRYYTNDNDYISHASPTTIIQTKNGPKLTISKETMVKTKVESGGYVVGLRLYISDKQSKSLQPYVVRLYDSQCKTEQWSKTIAATEFIDKKYIDIQVPLFIGSTAPFCWSIEPLKPDLGKQTYVIVPRVKGTNEPVVSPLYLYRE